MVRLITFHDHVGKIVSSLKKDLLKKHSLMDRYSHIRDRFTARLLSTIAPVAFSSTACFRSNFIVTILEELQRAKRAMKRSLHSYENMVNPSRRENLVVT